MLEFTAQPHSVVVAPTCAAASLPHLGPATTPTELEGDEGMIRRETLNCSPLALHLSLGSPRIAKHGA